MSRLLKNKRALWFLIILGVIMSLTAMRIDYKDFVETPLYLWIFVPICPLYPMLLAVNYFGYMKNGSFNQPLLHFTAIGIISYGVMAFFFYPIYMFFNGFAWYETGNIFWVTIYAVQIFIILPYLKKIPAWWYSIFASYFLLKDWLDRFSITFSYTRYGLFTDIQSNALLIIIVILHLYALIFLFLRERSEQDIFSLKKTD
jgi:hypothetical protein